MEHLNDEIQYQNPKFQKFLNDLEELGETKRENYATITQFIASSLNKIYTPIRKYLKDFSIRSDETEKEWKERILEINIEKIEEMKIKIKKSKKLLKFLDKYRLLYELLEELR